MDRFQRNPESRDAKLIEATRSRFSSLTRGVINGDQQATKRITDALGDFLADDQAAASLVQSTLQHSAERSFEKVLTDIIWAEAAELAEQDVQQMERRRAEAEQNSRIEQHVWERFFSRVTA